MGYMWRYIKRYPGLLLVNLIGALSFVGVILILPAILARMIDQGIMPGDRGQLFTLGTVMFVVVIGGLVGRIIFSHSYSAIPARMIRDMRNDLFDKIQQFSHEEYDKIGVSSLVTRMVNDAFVLMQFAQMMLSIGFSTPLMLIGAVVLIIRTSLLLAGIWSVVIPFLIAIIVIIAIKSKPLSSKQQKLLDKINQYARENLTGLRVIRAFAREDYQEERFDEANEAYRKVSDRLFKLMGAAEPLFFHVLAWNTLMIIYFSLNPIDNGELHVGILVAFLEYAFHALFSIMLFSQMFMMYPRMSVSARRLQEVMEMPISIQSGEANVQETETHGYVEFDNVTFAYPGATENPVLHGISFKAKPGEMVAFIGSTGSGKSTLVQLIPRFYDVTYGKVMVDGVDVRDYNLAALRKKIGYIPQKALLFTGTIGENLRYGKYDATLGELEKASDVAQASDFINQTDDRYQSFLAEGGSNLSGGQKQRLSIARAIVKEPDIYVFDDSFSALDYRTDAELRRRLKEVTQRSTVLVVAQRVSSIMGADQIIVLNEGEIVGRGTHEELMVNNELYRSIADSQMKNPSLEE